MMNQAREVTCAKHSGGIRWLLLFGLRRSVRLIAGALQAELGARAFVYEMKDDQRSMRAVDERELLQSEVHAIAHDVNGCWVIFWREKTQY